VRQTYTLCMSKELVRITAHEKRREINEVKRLHAELVAMAIDSVNRGIRIGELLLEIKAHAGHGNWRRWVEANLPFSYRTARRYQFLYQHRKQIGMRKPKTIAEAEKAMEKAAKASVMDAISADYSRIDRDLIAPIRLVRRRVRKVTYIGDDPRTMEMIWENLEREVQELLEDLKLPGLEPLSED
jgi:DUF3102 family protein